jgi:hypothetical protein
MDDLRGVITCSQCGEKLVIHPSLTARVDPANDGISKATTEYHLNMLRGIERRESPIRVSPTGEITVKCDTPDCRTYVAGENLRRMKVTILVNDPDNPTQKVPVQRDRDLCPHCAALSSRNGTQSYDPRTPAFRRDLSGVNIWKGVDRRSSAEIDPETLREMRKRYKP